MSSCCPAADIAAGRQVKSARLDNLLASLDCARFASGTISQDTARTATSRLFSLPAADADPGFWRPLGDRLGGAWDKVYFGWPGLGREPPHPEVTGLDDLVRLVDARLDAGHVDLLAQSIGGLIALLVTLRHPGRIRRLVLSVTSAGVPMARLGAADWRDSYFREYPNAAPWLRDIRADLSAELPRITQPVLLLWGDRDPISPVAVGEYLHARLPNARLHIVRGGEHDVVAARADEVAPIIARHLA
jgi:pimeloyl-ACP methyl ester carboxylesterase